MKVYVVHKGVIHGVFKEEKDANKLRSEIEKDKQMSGSWGLDATVYVTPITLK